MAFNFNGKEYDVELDDEGKYIANQLGRLNQEIAELSQRLEEKQMAQQGYAGKLQAKLNSLEAAKTTEDE